MPLCDFTFSHSLTPGTKTDLHDWVFRLLYYDLYIYFHVVTIPCPNKPMGPYHTQLSKLYQGSFQRSKLPSGIHMCIKFHKPLHSSGGGEIGSGVRGERLASGEYPGHIFPRPIASYNIPFVFRGEAGGVALEFCKLDIFLIFLLFPSESRGWCHDNECDNVLLQSLCFRKQIQNTEFGDIYNNLPSHTPGIQCLGIFTSCYSAQL